MRVKERGSIAIEAALSISICMVLIITLFGSLLSVALDEKLQWTAMQTRDDLSLYAMPFMGHERFVQEKVNEVALTEIAKQSLKSNLKSNGLNQLITLDSKCGISFDDYGFATFRVAYSTTILSIDSHKELYVPIGAAVMGDGVDFSEGMVYITTYGEKYHKSDCFHLRKSKYGITLEAAKEKGYEACKNCYGKEPIEK